MGDRLRLVLDVDVVLDVLAGRRPHEEASAAVWSAIELGRAKGMVAAHTVTTIHYLLTRHTDRSTASAGVRDLLSVFDVAAVDGETLREALGYGWSDFEDAVQMAAAVSAGATHMVTRNTADYRGAPLPVVTPAEALPLLQSSDS